MARSTFRTRALTFLFAGLLLPLGFSANRLIAAGPGQPQNGDVQSEVRPERGGTWRGRIDALVVDNFQNGTSRTRFFLHTSRETLELQGAETAALRSGDQVEVTGRLYGSKLAVSQLAASPAPAAAATNACSAIGQQKVAVILVSFPSKALLSSVTPALVSASFFGTGRTLNNFLLESSFGQTSVSGDVLGPYVLGADYFDEPLAVRDAAVAAAAPFTNLTQYSRIFVVAPQGQTGLDSGGMALLGCGPVSSPQGTLNVSSIWMGAESMAGQDGIVDIASHEMGHGFGLEHARYADYSGESLGPAGQAPAPWDGLHEYGDSYSSMGRQSAQWAAPQKALLNWLQSGVNVQTVTTGGTFTLSPYEQAGGGQVLKVSRDSSGNDWLWLEYRQPQGTFDATLPAAAFAGALVHYQDPGLTATMPGVDPNTYTNLLNFHPATAFFTSPDPTLHPGETWTDPYGSVSLTVNSATASGLSVTVSYAAAPVCPGSLGAAQLFASSGGAGQASVTAPAGCAWSASASVPWISLGTQVSGTGNGTVTFNVAANPNVAPRWGRIASGGAIVVISQSGTTGSMTLTPQSASVAAAGGTGEFAVATSAADYAWSFQSQVPWITDVECSCYQSVGPATLRYIVAANSGPQRTGTILAGGLVFTVTQSAGAASPGAPSYTLLSPVNAPMSRNGQAMAPFSVFRRHVAILYGGQWNLDFFADTWLWDGSNWTLLSPANNPGLLSQHAMAYDQLHGQIVLFGGVSGTTFEYTNQTWVFDGTNWQQMHPAVSPPARYGHAMAYDPVHHNVVLFGGYGDYGEANDTWTWDGANWTQASSQQSPSPRTGHSMVFDEAHGQMVLFGGFQSQPAPTWFSDTWLWDGAAWHQALLSAPPAPRFGHLLAYHPGFGAVVMIGGAGGKEVTDTSWNYDFRNETWMWTGQAWVQLFPANQPGPAYTLGASIDETGEGLTFHLGDALTCATRGPQTFVLEGPTPAILPYKCCVSTAGQK